MPHWKKDCIVTLYHLFFLVFSSLEKINGKCITVKRIFFSTLLSKFDYRHRNEARGKKHPNIIMKARRLNRIKRVMAQFLLNASVKTIILPFFSYSSRTPLHVLSAFQMLNSGFKPCNFIHLF